MMRVARMIGDGCFPAGTMVAVTTAIGTQPRAIESLQPDESIATAAGPMRLVAIEPCEPPPTPGAAIRLLPGAFGPGRPNQELLVTPEQLLYVRDDALPEGALIPAGALVNGRGVQRTTRPDGLSWFALALESHGLPLVGNLPAGSLREAGAPLAVRLLPPGPALFALRSRLARGAVAEAPQPPPVAPPPAPVASPAPAPNTVSAPSQSASSADLPVDSGADLALFADGSPAPTLPAPRPGCWCFIIPPGATALRLRSPIGRPSGSAEDSRSFGVAIHAILLDGIPLNLDGPAAGDGFHSLERHEHRAWRWTNGDAALLLPPCATPRRLEIAINDWHLSLNRA